MTARVSLTGRVLGIAHTCAKPPADAAASPVRMSSLYSCRARAGVRADRRTRVKASAPRPRWSGTGASEELGAGVSAYAGDDPAFDDDIDHLVEAPGGVDGSNRGEDQECGRVAVHDRSTGRVSQFVEGGDNPVPESGPSRQSRGRQRKTQAALLQARRAPRSTMIARRLAFILVELVAHDRDDETAGFLETPRPRSARRTWRSELRSRRRLPRSDQARERLVRGLAWILGLAWSPCILVSSMFRFGKIRRGSGANCGVRTRYGVSLRNLMLNVCSFLGSGDTSGGPFAESGAGPPRASMAPADSLADSDPSEVVPVADLGTSLGDAWGRRAKVAELADAQDSGSCGVTPVRVRLPPFAPTSMLRRSPGDSSPT